MQAHLPHPSFPFPHARPHSTSRPRLPSIRPYARSLAKSRVRSSASMAGPVRPPVHARSPNPPLARSRLHFHHPSPARVQSRASPSLIRPSSSSLANPPIQRRSAAFLNTTPPRSTPRACTRPTQPTRDSKPAPNRVRHLRLARTMLAAAAAAAAWDPIGDLAAEADDADAFVESELIMDHTYLY